MTTRIRDHVWRPSPTNGGQQSGLHGGPAIRPGMCGHLGTCDQPREDHVTTAEYRRSLRAVP